MHIRLIETGLRLQQGVRISATELAAENECSMRTVQRDIAELRLFYNMPIEYCRITHTYYCTDKNFCLRAPLELTEGELLSIYLGMNILRQCTGTTLEGSIKSTFDRIVRLLPGNLSIESSAMLESISLELPPLRGDGIRAAQCFAALAEAVRDKKSVDILYRGINRDEDTERTVDPCRLCYRDGAWYLIAWCRLRGAMRYFALDRILKFEITRKSFTLPQDVDIDAWIAESFGFYHDERLHEVAVRFDAFTAKWVRERVWHHSQQKEEHDDGSLTLRLTVSGLESVKRWILAYGSHAEVLAPAELKEMIRAEIKAMAAVYTAEK